MYYLKIVTKIDFIVLIYTKENNLTIKMFNVKKINSESASSNLLVNSFLLLII